MNKKIFTFLLFVCISSLCSYAQLSGKFYTGQDGHIYFQLYNPTPYPIPVKWGVQNFSTGEHTQNMGTMMPSNSFIYGPNTNWVWIKGEIFYVVYGNGQTAQWTCPQTDPSVNRSNPTFTGKVCTETVGCDCTGFVPITDGAVWEQSICKKCNHKKRNHKH